MDQHKERNAVRATFAILVISASLLLAAAGLNTYVGNAAQGHVERDVSDGSFGDARLTDGLTPTK